MFYFAGLLLFILKKELAKKIGYLIIED